MLRQTAPATTLGTMPDSPLLTAAAVAVIVLAIAVVVGVGFKVLRSFRDLGTDAERATYNTLHAASRAGQHLRTGLNPAGAAKASRSCVRCWAVMRWRSPIPRACSPGMVPPRN